MQSLGNDSSASSTGRFGAARAASFRIGGLGMSVVVLAFLVAVIFAANQNDVVGWVVAVIAFGWLALAAFVVWSIRKATQRASAKIGEARNAFNSATGRAPANDGGTRLVAERSAGDEVRDLKLDHSFKIVQVQLRVVQGEMAKGAAANQDTVRRALETIEITSSNARDMIKESGAGQEPVTGEVID
ncbi:hypothetical protein ACQR35_07015 [Pseudarthrobacter sp. J1738]|uniref:hypothetical protein n=1 Tax=unclassified Pseudarthrobacter TaxID=2647000 RepID=UPI003D2DD0AE